MRRIVPTFGAEPLGRGDPQVLQPFEGPVAGGETHADRHFAIAAGILGSIVRHLDAGGQKLHGLAEERNVGAVARGFLAIDRQLPFDAGKGTCIGHVLIAADLVHEAAHLGDRL